MNRERFLKAKSIFLEAVRLPSPRQAIFVRETCGGDPEVGEVVQAMLAADARPPALMEVTDRSSLERLWADALEDDPSAAGLNDALPEHIGLFRIVRRIGEGGMGAIFEAEQDHPRRTVALKLLRGVISNPRMLRRFDREVEALGRLQHPGIARIYGAGTAQVGGITLPYFTMELVRGATLREYVDQNQPSIRQRLDLVVRICKALQHAHQHGIVHRDLKPENILVVEDGKPQPKILDFGVARALDSDVCMTTQQTDVGQLIGTLRYMSPEQTSGDPSNIDARSDVYSLGVILYELLTGQSPYSIDYRMVPEALRVIREVEPARPSSINIVCRGDLDTVMTKALDKDPRRRYQFALELGEDLRRYLANEPILARRAGRIYRLEKFAARHRGLVAGLAFTAVALVGGTTLSTALYFSASSERDKAQQALDESEEVTAFLADLLSSATPESRADGVLVAELLDQAAATISDRFADRPIIEAKLLDTVGQAYLSLLEHDKAAPFIQQAFEIRCRELGPRDPATAMSLQHRAMLASAQGRHADAERLAAQAVEIQTELFGAEQDPTLCSLEVLAEAIRVQGRNREALAILQTTYRVRMQISGLNDPKTIHATGLYAAALCGVGGRSEAEPLYRSIVETAPRSNAWELSRALVNLGMIYRETGRYQEAADAFDKNTALLDRHFGKDHRIHLKNRTEFAVLRLRQHDYDEAERILTDVLERSKRAYGQRHPHTLWTAYCLIETLREKDDLQRALPVAEWAVDETERQAPGFLQLLGRVHRDLGETYEAAALETEAASLPDLGGHPWQHYQPEMP